MMLNHKYPHPRFICPEECSIIELRHLFLLKVAQYHANDDKPDLHDHYRASDAARSCMRILHLFCRQRASQRARQFSAANMLVVFSNRTLLSRGATFTLDISQNVRSIRILYLIFSQYSLQF